MDERRLEKLANDFDTKTHVFQGVVRWKDNGQVPANHVLRGFLASGKPFNYSASVEAAKSDFYNMMNLIH